MKNNVKDKYVDEVISLLKSKDLSDKEVKRVIGSAYGRLLKKPKK